MDRAKQLTHHFILRGEHMIKDYVVGIGLDAVKERLKNEHEVRQLKERLDEFVERQRKLNFNCTREEELDFGGLTDYIRSDLIENVQARFFGNKEARAAAHRNIISKSIVYAQSNTKLSRKRAIEMVERAINILREFYKSRVNRDLKFIAAQIEDTVCEQTTNLEKVMAANTEKLAQKIDSIQIGQDAFPIAASMKLMQEGNITQVEQSLNNWFDAVGCTHLLYPDYRYELENGSRRFYSRPSSKQAIQKYPPKIACTGTIQMGDKYLDKFDAATIDYANRHQLPITLNVETAKKYLGSFEDPIQHEAEDLIGQKLIVKPQPFPPAFPCSIAVDGETIFDYVLFRTQEIQDDGTILISNAEQQNTPFKISLSANTGTAKTALSIKTDNPRNEDLLKYVRFFKSVSAGATISIKVLSLGEELASGKFSNIDYQCGFDNVDEELDFLEKVVAIEKHFGGEIDIPSEITEDDYRVISYLATLVTGGVSTGSWSKFEVSIPVTDELKERMRSEDNSVFSLSYVGSISVSLYNRKYELNAIKRFEAVQYQNLERLKQKVDVLDIGDDIKLTFLPPDGTEGKWSDMLDPLEEA